LLIVLLSASAVFLAVFSIAAGASSIGLGDVLKWITGRADVSAVTILRYARLPRTVGCILVGSALSVSGLLLQTALGNPLASPGVIGVNAGSGFFVVLAAAFFPSVFWIKGAAAFLGALTAAMTVYAIAKRTGASRITIVLAGVAVSGMLTALIDAVTTLRPDSVMDKTEFYIGGFSSIQSHNLRLVLPVILITIIFAQLFAGRLELLLLGDEVAGSLGLNVGRCRFFAVTAAALLAAGAVSIAGLIGFVGLMVPHIARQFVGGEIRRALPVTALLGVILTLFCDILARLIFAPFEIPAGILLSLVGAPFFLYLVLTRRRRRYD